MSTAAEFPLPPKVIPIMASMVFYTCVSAFLQFLVMVPFWSAVVRWRAHYNPKRVRHQNHGGEGQPLVENASTIAPALAYFTILKRVYKVEGFKGYYKGFVPYILSMFLFIVVHEVIFKYPRTTPSEGNSQREDTTFRKLTIYFARSLYSWIVHSAYDMPLEIIAHRAITTPYKLPWLSPSKSLGILLSPSERRSPWRLYLLPGYLASRAIMAAYWLGIEPLRVVLVPGNPLDPDHTGKELFQYLLFAGVFALVQTPLQVAIVRLSLQRYHDTEPRGGDDRSGRGRVSKEREAGIQRYSNEDVITLKDTNRFPYTGLFDCVNKIINEEGWKTLMKSGWLTFLGM
ncbi:hypothetical protein PQX77_005864 [Marasmius sp. AFHP31]|nr:hypothetical protein PQX77_005864 [Marasmius sp. AFHP31]